MRNKPIYLLQIGILCLGISLFLGINDVWAAGNPFDTINSNLTSFADTIIKIVQVLGIIALVFFGAYSMLSGNLDKVRLGLIVVGIIIISGAKPIVNFFASWIK